MKGSQISIQEHRKFEGTLIESDKVSPAIESDQRLRIWCRETLQYNLSILKMLTLTFSSVARQSWMIILQNLHTEENLMLQAFGDA
jgi:hypothetical protein